MPMPNSTYYTSAANQQNNMNTPGYMGMGEGPAGGPAGSP